MATMKPASLTTFVDFVLKSGTPKLTVVQTFKQQLKYDPRTDFYKNFREPLIACLVKGHDLSTLSGLVRTVTEKKRGPYGQALSGVRRFLGRKTLAWFDPPRKIHALGEMTVIVNPEIGALVNGQPHIIKLYLKEEALKSNRAELILHLMRSSLGAQVDGKKLAVLEARTGKLFAATPKTRGLDALLFGEAASFVAMYGKA